MPYILYIWIHYFSFRETNLFRFEVLGNQPKTSVDTVTSKSINNVCDQRAPSMDIKIYGESLDVKFSGATEQTSEPYDNNNTQRINSLDSEQHSVTVGHNKLGKADENIENLESFSLQNEYIEDSKRIGIFMAQCYADKEL